MSEKDVKKIAFCSLDEYKTIQKEEGTEYIIDAADISEAITNSDAIDPGHTAESHPLKEEVYKIPVFVKRIFVNKEHDNEFAEDFIVDVYKINDKYFQKIISSNIYYIPINQFSQYYNYYHNNQNLDLDQFYDSNNNIEHIAEEFTYQDKKFYFHCFKFIHHPGFESSIDNNSYNLKNNFFLSTISYFDQENLYEEIYNRNFNNLSTYFSNEILDTDPFLVLLQNDGYTNYFIVEADSKEIPEKYQEQFRAYKQKIKDHFLESKMGFYVKSLIPGKYYDIPENFIDIYNNSMFSLNGPSEAIRIKKYDPRNKEDTQELMMYFEKIAFKE